MIGSTSLEVYNFIFTIPEENMKFELYTDNCDEFSFEQLRIDLEEILSISDVTSKHLQSEKVGPRNIQAYKKLRLEKSSTDRYIILLIGYARSPFRVFESYRRIVDGLNETDIELVLKQYNSNFVTDELSPVI